MKVIFNPEACLVCKFYSCVCAILLGHQKECSYRKAATSPIGIDCPHGYDVCPQCDPCNCTEKADVRSNCEVG